MSNRHKHADLIHAWAEGKEIQYYSNIFKDWLDLSEPSWNLGDEYRLKPEKPYGKYDKIIESVVNEVDFESIRKVMVALDWTGYDSRVPTIDDLKNTVIQLTNDLLVKNLAETSSCGFTVKWYLAHHDTIRVSFRAVSDIFVPVGKIK